MINIKYVSAIRENIIELKTTVQTLVTFGAVVAGVQGTKLLLLSIKSSNNICKMNLLKKAISGKGLLQIMVETDFS